MDFSRHGTGPQPVRTTSQPVVDSGIPTKQKSSPAKNKLSGWTRIGYTGLLFATTILVVAIAGLVAFSGNNESKYIDTSKYQAVFLNDGSSSGQSVYFGHITKLANSYLILQNIYYITTSSSGSSSSSNNNYTLTKLGCQQLHDPYDQMVINMSQVAFWENLQNGGKVVQSIQQFQKENPNGPNCNQASTSNTSQGTTQNATTQNGSTSNATTQQNSNTSTGSTH